MPQYHLKINATLENLAELQAPDDMTWHIKFECNSCNEVHEKFTTLSVSQSHDGAGKGTFNLVQKCKL